MAGDVILKSCSQRRKRKQRLSARSVAVGDTGPQTALGGWLGRHVRECVSIFLCLIAACVRATSKELSQMSHSAHGPHKLFNAHTQAVELAPIPIGRHEAVSVATWLRLFTALLCVYDGPEANGSPKAQLTNVSKRHCCFSV